MIRRLRLLPLARLAAGLLTLVLAGAPRLMVQAAPEAPHRCQCARHGADEVCACRRCRAAAARAREAESAQLPPCHREAARRAAEEESLPADGPCLEGTCGSGPDHHAFATGLDPFTVQGTPPPPLVPEADREPAARAAARSVPHLPETPPPRR